MTQLATLYIVPTPIGHLEDITQRALTILREVELIVAEDTRHSGRLLKHFGIQGRFFALHDHNEVRSVPILVKKLQAGTTMALVADAGTPLLSDPGFHLVRRCHATGIRVVPLPGPCAAITALSAAGVATDRFCFEGFLPAKQVERCRNLYLLSEEPRTLIFYESCHRLVESLQDMVTVFGEKRHVVLARELTKLWEQIHGAPVNQLLDWVRQDPWRCRGEMVLVVEGHRTMEQILPRAAQQTLALLMAELPLKKAAALAASIHNIKKNVLYRYGLTLIAGCDMLLPLDDTTL